MAASELAFWAYGPISQDTDGEKLLCSLFLQVKSLDTFSFSHTSGH